MQPIDVVRRFIIEYQTGRHRAAALELLAPDFIDHTPFPGFGPERESVLALFNMLWMAFPDLTPEILEQLAQDDRVATRKVFRVPTEASSWGWLPQVRRSPSRSSISYASRTAGFPSTGMWSTQRP